MNNASSSKRKDCLIKNAHTKVKLKSKYTDWSKIDTRTKCVMIMFLKIKTGLLIKYFKRLWVNLIENINTPYNVLLNSNLRLGM